MLLIEILDSLQAQRPFYQELFKTVMETYHIKWTEQLRAGYNTLYKQMSGGQVVMFANLITKQTRLNTKYGMLDPRYERCLGDLMTTFYSRTFKNIMPLVLQVIERMKTEYYKEKDTICLSHGPVDLFKFVNEIIDQAIYCPSQLVIKGVLGLVAQIINNFQKEYKSLVLEAEDMEMPVFCSLTNSNVKFISALRGVVDRILSCNILKEHEIHSVGSIPNN